VQLLAVIPIASWHIGLCSREKEGFCHAHGRVAASHSQSMHDISKGATLSAHLGSKTRSRK
jgi:hypothetical protein